MYILFLLATNREHKLIISWLCYISMSYEKDHTIVFATIWMHQIFQVHERGELMETRISWQNPFLILYTYLYIISSYR